MSLPDNENEKDIRLKIISAVIEDPEIIFVVKERYVDESLWRFCIERDTSVFRKMKHPSEEICMFACEVDGANLRWIRNKFSYIKITDMMAYIAVKSNPTAILYVPDKLLTNTLMEMAFDADSSLMAYFDHIQLGYLTEKLKSDPSAIQYIKDPDEDLICDLIQRNPTVCVYIKELSKKMLHVLKKNHPNYYQLYQNNLEGQKETKNDIGGEE